MSKSEPSSKSTPTSRTGQKSRTRPKTRPQRPKALTGIQGLDTKNKA